MSAGARVAAPPPTRQRGETLGHATVILIVVATVATLSAFFDARLAAWAEALPQDAKAWGAFVSRLGQSDYMFAIAGVLLVGGLLARSRVQTTERMAALTVLAERAAFVVATLAASGLAAQTVKHLVGRARPRFYREFGPYHFDVLSLKNSLASFPSGHTTTAFAMAVALAMLCPSLRVALFTLAVAIGASRIVVQAHYVSDVVAGGLLGAGSALLMAHIMAGRGIAFTKDAAGTHLKGRGLIGAGWRS